MQESEVTFTDLGLFARGLAPLTGFVAQVPLQVPDHSNLNGCPLSLLKVVLLHLLPSMLFFFDHMEIWYIVVSSVNSPILSVHSFILIHYLPARRRTLALGCL